VQQAQDKQQEQRAQAQQALQQQNSAQEQQNGQQFTSIAQPNQQGSNTMTGAAVKSLIAGQAPAM
jgi:hypothetical protein